MNKEKMDVELYIIHTGFLDEEEVFQKRLNQVSFERRQKVLACKIREDQKRSLAAGLLVERIVEEHGYSSRQITSGEDGKPYLSGVDDFFFSISHSGEYAVCAVGDVPVGVDIQQKRRTRLNIARRFFASQEADEIEKQPEDGQDEMFFRYWTGKESYLKLTGQGIMGGLDSFLVDLKEKRILDLYSGQKEIYLKEYHCLEDYYITVACYSKKFAAFVRKIYYRM